MKQLLLKPSSTLIFQATLVLVGIGVLGFLLWEPHVEGRNAHATVFEIYFRDPFLAYVYVGSTPFFVALHRAFIALGQVRQNGAFTPGTVAALRTIQRCAIAVIGFVAGAACFIVFFGDGEDRPAGIFMCLLFTLAASVVAAAAAKCARCLQPTAGQSEGTEVEP